MAFGRYVENIKAELMGRTDCSLVDPAWNSWFIPNSIKDSWSVKSRCSAGMLPQIIYSTASPKWFSRPTERG